MTLPAFVESICTQPRSSWIRAALAAAAPALLAISPHVAAGQATWRDIFSMIQRSPDAPRLTWPQCYQGEHPSRVLLVGAPGATVSVWEPEQRRWRTVPGAKPGDTSTVQLYAVLCFGNDVQSVVVATDGRYASIARWQGLIRMPGRNGSLAPLTPFRTATGHAVFGTPSWAADSERVWRAAIAESTRVQERADVVEAAARRRQLRERGWSSATIDAIVNHQIGIGMTDAQVIESWGPPDHVNRTVTAYGTTEQWVYGQMSGSYVYFENGRVTAIQDAH